MVSLRQLDVLLSFMEQHKNLALGKCARTKEGRGLAKRLWAQCANRLNSVSPHGQTKTAESWRLFYNEYKSKILRKMKKLKADQQARGGGPVNTKLILTPLQQRLYYDVLGENVGGPSNGTRNYDSSKTTNEDPLTCETNTQIKLEVECSRETDIRSVSQDSPSGADSYYVPKRQCGLQDIPIAEPEMNEADLPKNEELNECDLYGQLLAQKLKTLDVEDRLVVMNGIDNYVFKYLMNVKKRNSSMMS